MTMQTSALRYKVRFWATIIITLGLVLSIEVLSARFNYFVDLTKYKKYSLSQPTKRLLDSLSQDIRLVAFIGIDAPEYKQIKDLCHRYAAHHRRISCQFVDPKRNPGRLKESGVIKYGQEKHGVLVVETDTRKELVQTVTEESISNAILRITNPTRKVIYFLMGHGENDPFMPTYLETFRANPKSYRLAREALEERIWKAKELYLAKENRVPEDASILIVAGPEVEIPLEEVKAIEDYITRGGRAFFLLDPFTGRELKELLQKYCIILGDDILVDTVNQIQGSDFLTPLVNTYEEHIITKDLSSLSAVFSWARSVNYEPSFLPALEVQALLKTSPESWGTENLEGINRGEVAFRPQMDKKGPLPIGVIATSVRNTTSSRLAVFGDSDFASDVYLNLYANRDLFLNVVSWLGEEEQLISIQVKSPQHKYNPLSRNQARILFWLPVVIQPGLIIIIGALVTVLRRIRS